MAWLAQVYRTLRNVGWLVWPGGFRRRLESVHDRLTEIEENLTRRIVRLDGMLTEVERMAGVLHQYRRSRARVFGHLMWLDPDDTVVSRRLCLDGRFEAFETRLAARLVRPGDVAFDIGANIGYYTLLLARQVGPRGRVFAFEPDPRNFDLLRRNVEENGYTNVTLVPKAVAETTGTRRLYRNGENLGDHRLYDSHDGRDSVAVETAALDEMFAAAGARVDFIKMDIQGAEWSALHGMRRLLRHNPQVRLMTEFWPRGLRLSGGDAGRFLAALRELGFALSVIDAQADCIEPLDEPALLRRLPVEQDTDWLFTTLLGLGPACRAADFIPDETLGTIGAQAA